MPASAAIIAVMAWLLAGSSYATVSSSEAGLTADQLVQVALEANPEVKGARARWLAAVHSIQQN
ncbi:MAG: hypothetical protein ACRETL_17735, partial [Gammaproteobacteria bacterium]